MLILKKRENEITRTQQTHGQETREQIRHTPNSLASHRATGHALG